MNFLDANEVKRDLMCEIADEIGFKYLKRGALKKSVKDLIFEINFFSSKWNKAGESMKINADFRLIYKKYGKIPVDNIVARMSYNPNGGYWYDITTEKKYNKTKAVLLDQFNKTVVMLSKMFEDNYEFAIEYLLNEGFDKYNVALDFIVDSLGVDSISDRVDMICKQLSQSEKEQIAEYKNGSKTKGWMINRCNLKYIIDNDLYREEN